MRTIQDVVTMKTPILASLFLLAAAAVFGASAGTGGFVPPVTTPTTTPPSTSCPKTDSKETTKKEAEKKEVEKKDAAKKVEKKKDDDKWPVKRS